MRRDVARVAVREEHRRCGLVQNVVHRGLGHMADVDNHPQPVHFGEHFKPKGRQSVMLWRIGGAVRPIGGQAVRDGHIPRAKRVSLPQNSQ